MKQVIAGGRVAEFEESVEPCAIQGKSAAFLRLQIRGCCESGVLRHSHPRDESEGVAEYAEFVGLRVPDDTGGHADMFYKMDAMMSDGAKDVVGGCRLRKDGNDKRGLTEKPVRLGT